MPSEELRDTVNDYDLIMKCWSPRAIIYDPLKAGSIDGTDTEPHDLAITRALNSIYKPNKKVKGKPECTIFIARLSDLTTTQDIEEAFSQFGTIKRCRLVEDIVTGRSRGYAFVEYDSETSAALAYRRGNKIRIDGKEVFVDMECERLLPGWVPRRLGGGFSGKKESGQLRFGGRDRHFRKPISLLSIQSIRNTMEKGSNKLSKN